MTDFRIFPFGGLVPRASKRLLDPTQAQVAANTKLLSGEIRPMYEALLVNTPTKIGTFKTIFRLTDGILADKWLVWTTDVDVARGPIAGDTTVRVYYTGDGEPRETNYALATTGGTDYPVGYYVLGLPPPSVAGSLAVAGGVGPVESRVYGYTYLTAWGEEGPFISTASVSGNSDGTWNYTGLDTGPLNAVSVTGAVIGSGIVTVTVSTTTWIRTNEVMVISGIAGMTELNGTWTITVTDATHFTVTLAATNAYTSGGTVTRQAPFQLTGMTKNIYRTVTDANGVASYLLVTNIPLATTSYADTTASSSLSIVLPSTAWIRPPADMRGLIALPNGMMAGFSGNTLCFSEPWHPHAWPLKYQVTTDYPIVALGAFGNSVVVMTIGMPSVWTGSHPSNMSETKIEMEYPCVAKRGVANMGVGVIYPCPDGLVLVGIGGTDKATKTLFARDEWQNINPTSLVATTHDGRYYAYHDVMNGTGEIMVIDRNEPASLYTINTTATALYTDHLSGIFYYVSGNGIYQWEGDKSRKKIFDWMSREFVFLPPENFGACKVDADFSMSATEIAAIQSSITTVTSNNQALLNALNDGGALNESEINGLDIDGDKLTPIPDAAFDSLQINLYAGGILKFSKQLFNSKAFSLPAGYKKDTLEARVTGNVTVKGIVIGETKSSLRNA